jgi:uncharacterized RDD family membrane protein YckC
MNDNFEPAGLFRRFAAIFYDFLMLIAVLIMAGFLAKIIGFIPPVLTDDQPKDLMFWILKMSFNFYIYVICYFFFVYPWMRNGQTLGMQAWKIKVVNVDGSNLSYKTASIRFFVAILSWLTLGFGFWRAIFDKEKRTWHDALSQTRLIKMIK